MSRWWSEHAYHNVSYTFTDWDAPLPVTVTATIITCPYKPCRLRHPLLLESWEGGQLAIPNVSSIQRVQEVEATPLLKGESSTYDKMCVWCISGFLWNNFLAKKNIHQMESLWLICWCLYLSEHVGKHQPLPEVSGGIWNKLPSLKLVPKAPENGWLEY